MVMGAAPYEFVTKFYRKAHGGRGLRAARHSAVDLDGVETDRRGRCEIENQYARVVAERGNEQALAAVARVYELREFFEWRGLGSIDHSGVRLRANYAAFDAERKFALPNVSIADPKSCQCGEVLKGVIKPWQCKVFGTACTPEIPLGALMVSSEGACAAYYQYTGVKQRREVA